MTETQNPSPAEVLARTIDESRYELVQAIRRMGTRINEAIRDYQEIAQAAQNALTRGERPLGGSHTPDNPVQLLRDVEDLCKTARLLGVPEQCILDARRGEFVALHDYTTPRR